MNIIGPDELLFGVDDVAACTQYLSDYGLTPVDVGPAGGRFEALIGVGYVIGPVAGMLAGGTQAQLVGATWAAALLGIAPAIMPWLAWRRRLRTEQRAHA